MELSDIYRLILKHADTAEKNVDKVQPQSERSKPRPQGGCDRRGFSRRIENVLTFRLEDSSGFCTDGSQLRKVCRVKMQFVGVRIREHARCPAQPFAAGMKHICSVFGEGNTGFIGPRPDLRNVND